MDGLRALAKRGAARALRAARPDIAWQQNSENNTFKVGSNQSQCNYDTFRCITIYHTLSL